MTLLSNTAYRKLYLQMIEISLVYVRPWYIHNTFIDTDTIFTKQVQGVCVSIHICTVCLYKYSHLYGIDLLVIIDFSKHKVLKKKEEKNFLRRIFIKFKYVINELESKKLCKVSKTFGGIVKRI